HTQTPEHPENCKYSLNYCLLPLVAENPQIKCTVYLAPYHIYTYCQSEQFGEADGLIRQRTLVMKELLKYPNVTLHDYQADRSFVCNSDFFSDVQHFSSKAARRLLSDLASGRRVLKSDADVDANEKELRDLIKEQMPLYYADLAKYKK
ncbi:MAG: hypothetical protein J6R00_07355, partial [Lentisphaeria bacterium]|nr:hypothetical protein [Lentisphaeria bacterium]